VYVCVCVCVYVTASVGSDSPTAVWDGMWSYRLRCKAWLTHPSIHKCLWKRIH